MDEARLRQQVCQAAHQLWVRGLVTGDSGLVALELHRRRFLVTPTHARRPNLAADDILTVDMGGLSIQGGGPAGAIPEAIWQPIRAAFKATLGGELEDAGATGGPTSAGRPAPRRRIITAVVLADPPILLALMRLLPGHDRIDLPGLGPVPLVDGRDDREIAHALHRSPGVLVRGLGAVVAGDQLAAALNWLERLDAAAKAELAVGGPTGRTPRDAADPADTDLPDPPDASLAEEEAEPAETRE